jgi:hypothetical protein
MRKSLLFGIVATVLVAPACAEPRVQTDYVGFWELSSDEDGSPKETMEIRGNGTYVAHGWSCKTADVIPFHLHNGDMYATIEIPNKGPISIVFRLLEDGRISFTSPRTANNAYYSRLEQNPCPGNRVN